MKKAAPLGRLFFCFLVSLFFRTFVNMEKVLQSQLDNDLYHNGTILDKKGYKIALFGDIEQARIFTNNDDVQRVLDIIQVPVNVIDYEL